MILGCCISFEHYDTVVKAGFDAITFAGTDIASWSDEKFESIREKVLGGPLKCLSVNSFCPGDIPFHGKDLDLDVIEKYTDKVCYRASQLGCRYIGIGAGKNKRILPGEEREKAEREMDEVWRVLCSVAAKYNMDILMESITSLDTNYLTKAREAYALVKRLGIPNFHLVYDIYHDWADGQGPEVISEIADEIRVVHLSNLEKGKRTYLVEKDIPLYKAYYDEIRKAGYEGEFNIECFEKDPDEKIVESYRILKSFMD